MVDGGWRFDVFLSYNSADRAAVERVANRLREQDIGAWWDGWALTPGGTWQFNGALELSTRLAASPEVERCVATRWFEYAVGRERVTGDRCRVETFEGALARSGGDVRAMLVEWVKSPEFIVRPAVTP